MICLYAITAATYKVSVGGELIQTSSFETNGEGKVQLRFVLPKTLNTTDGLLNITIEHDAYTESISRSIPIVLNKIDLQFMPEGGTLVQEWKHIWHSGLSMNMENR